MNYYDQGTAAKGELPRESTFVDPIANAHELASAVSERLGALAERLCGPIPPAPAGSTPALGIVSNGGLLDDLANRGRDMGDRLDRALIALNRIERALP